MTVKKFMAYYVFGTIAFVSMLYVGVFYRFSNPDMTDTRIFLNNWYIILTFFISAILSGLFLYWDEN